MTEKKVNLRVKNDAPQASQIEMNFTIEKEIPMPVIKRKLKYPFDKLEVGDSFSFPVALIPNVRNSASRYAKAKGMKFLVRPDGKDLGRCWRRA